MAMFMRSVCILASWAVATYADSSQASSQLNQTSFSGYMQAFGKSYAKGSAEHAMREKIFTQRLAEILDHNAGDHSWEMALNQFTDYTEGELQGLRGFKRPHKGDSMMGGSSGIQLSNDIDDQSCLSKDQSCSNAQSCCGGLICGASGSCETPAEGAATMDWASKLPTSMEVFNQGPCGSCWAVAAAATVQLLAAKVEPKFNKILSPENINKCAPNPLSCGGEGGCQGSTPELAFDYLKSIGGASKGGLTTMDHMPYTASTGSQIPDASCKSSSLSFLQMTSLRSLRTEPPAVSIADWIKVKDNHAEHVMNALVSVGPLTVAVVGGGIQGYSKGVLSNCKSTVVDHAVVMTGFGKDAPTQMLYWNIRNSWGKEWGENGYLRIQRHYKKDTKTSGDPMTDAKFQGEPCAWDNDPAKGVACKDAHGKYPERTRVCGECGIVSDVAYPTGITVDPKLLV